MTTLDEINWSGDSHLSCTVTYVDDDANFIATALVSGLKGRLFGSSASGSSAEIKASDGIVSYRFEEDSMRFAWFRDNKKTVAWKISLPQPIVPIKSKVKLGSEKVIMTVVKKTNESWALYISEGFD